MLYDLFNLLTDINMRKAKSIDTFTDKRYENALFFESPIFPRILIQYSFIVII